MNLQNNLEKYFFELLTIIFFIFTIGLISYTLPTKEIDFGNFIEISRTLLLALGAGYFGLLGITIGGFTVSSSKTIEFIASAGLAANRKDPRGARPAKLDHTNW